jgi:CBS domain containing-hemolysin-like protein
VSAGELFIFALCFLLSGFFSGTESALQSLNEARTKHLIDQGHERLRLWLDKPHFVRNTILIGNNIANILASALAGSIAGRVFHDLGLGIAVAVMTILILIFGEVIPKNYASVHADRLAPRMMFALKPWFVFFWPASWVLGVLTHHAVSLAGGTMEGGRGISESELELYIEQSTKDGSIDAHAHRLLTQVLELDDTSVREAMVPRTDLITVEKDMGREGLLMLYGEHGHSRIPVEGESIDDIIGIVHIRDLFRDPNLKTAGQAMREPVFVSELQRTNVALKHFQANRIPFAIVVDEHGGTAGCIAIEDVIEVIVGDIRDEYEDEDEEVIPLAEGLWRVDGGCKVNDLEDALGYEFKESDEYDTVSGLVTRELGRLPEVGDQVEVSPYTFEVEATDGKVVERACVRFTPPPEEPTGELEAIPASEEAAS